MVFFQLVNLPVEFDASRRALQVLPETGILTAEETRDQLAFVLRTVANFAGPHLGPFVLPPLDAASPR